ncbi:AsnC family protein [Streptomyces sp. BE147]|uniref:AsnC family protein n=1 Tax=unclassified Streptomyces TaxID=2593676 RepID=UPI002E78D2AD|nr:AsnC family protein [Streptomyces sp. BE147]MEE1736844.1 AsnC family protein [Streptomyces sp. BE147]
MKHQAPAGTIDELDQRIIAELQLNGRAPWSAVARWVDASVRRRSGRVVRLGSAAVRAAGGHGSPIGADVSG